MMDGRSARHPTAPCRSYGTHRTGNRTKNFVTPCRNPAVCHAAFNSVNLAAGKNTVRAVVTVAVAAPEVAHAISATSTAAAAAPATGNFVLVANGAAAAAAPAVDLGQTGAVLTMLWPSVGSAAAVAAVAWAGLGPGALGSILQTYGQRSVSPPVAQVPPPQHCYTRSASSASLRRCLLASRNPLPPVASRWI